MNSRKLPPLYPLRSFESAARLGSFTAAATELNVGQSAVSHQVKALETYFGFALFHRGKGSPVLTAEGKRLFEVATRAFTSLEEVNHRLPDSQVSGSLAISTPPLFFSCWLASRLDRFGEAYPNIHFRLMHGIQMSKAEQNEADIAFHWGEALPPEFTGARFMNVEYAPVASSRLLADNPALRRVEGLKGRILLHETDYTGWKEWLSSAGASPELDPAGWVFDDPGMLLDAALHGHGVALVPFPLLNEFVLDGRLTKLFDHSIQPEKSYFCCISRRTRQKRQAKLFTDWITADGARQCRELATR